MKKPNLISNANSLAMALLLWVISTGSLYGQGWVSFANNSRLTQSYTYAKDDSVASMPSHQPGTIRFGLYVGRTNEALENLRLVAVASNSWVPGRFHGGFSYVLTNCPAGVPLQFQIRAWPTHLGASFEQANTNDMDGLGLFGVSEVGTVIPTAPPAIAPALFGTNQGQIRGFPLLPRRRL